MKRSKLLIMGLLLAVGSLLSSCGYEGIDAGCEGILVNLYGDDKGVGDVSLCTGAVWYNPITKALTPQILEQMWIEKWDGRLPVYGTVPTLFKDISK